MLEATPIPTTLGEFEVVRRIGRGGMGFVLEVRSRSTGAVSAAKLIVRAKDPLARERFRREAELLARCDRHPGVVKVHSFGETPDGSLYLVMDLVRGEGLDQVLDREEKLAPPRAAAIVRDVAAALGHAHALGIVHRDVKPANVLIDESGTVKLTDFGLATACDLEALTRTGQFVGTMRYASPEQAIGSGRPGPTTDVFALGTLLFALVAGRTPYEDQRTPTDVMRELGKAAEVPDVRTFAPACPEALARIAARALRKAPRERYPTGTELAQDLTLFLEGRPTTASSGASSAGPSRRRPLLVLGAALAVLGGGIALLPTLTRTNRGVGLLAEANESLERARTTLARHDRARPAAFDPELAVALEDARRALTEALAADSLGTAGASEVARDATSALTAAAVGLAEGHVAAGRGDEAHRLLDAIPGAPGSLTPEQRLLRARALLLEGRLDEREVGELLALPLAGRRAEALELSGDSLAARGEVAAAVSAYGAALEASPARPSALRVKRGVAAVRVHDDATAFADLASLVPDLARLPADRARNARLAGFAPALYRRGLATAGETPERDLEAAWRLADPPAELAGAVARRWTRIAEVPLQEWNEAYGTSRSLVDLPPLRHPIALSSRARQLDPTNLSPVVWHTFALIDNWAGRSGVDAALVETVVRGLLEESREPELLHLAAWAERRLRRDPASREDALALEREAIDGFPDYRPDEPRHVARLSLGISEGFVLGSAELKVDLDVARLQRIAGRGAGEGFFVQKASYYRQRGDMAQALAAIELAPPATPDEPFGLPNGEERVLTLFRAGRVEDAIAYVKSGTHGLEARLRGKLREIRNATSLDLETTTVASERAAKLLAIGLVSAGFQEIADAEKALVLLRKMRAVPEAARLEAAIERARASR